MNRRTLLTRTGFVFVSVPVSGVLAGCLEGPGSIDTVPSPSDSAENSNGDDGGVSIDGSIDGDDLERCERADHDSSGDEPSECFVLGDPDSDAVEEPDEVHLHNETDDDLTVATTIDLESDPDEHAVDGTLTIPSGATVVFELYDPEGHAISLETDGSTAETAVSSSNGGTSVTTIALTETGTKIETNTVSSA